jgi:hypothetical protein
VGTRDGRTQSARAWLFFFLHLDGLKTPIYTQTIVGIQKKVKEPQPKPPLYPSPQTHPPKNLKIWILIPSSWYIDTYPENLILEAMQVLLGFRTQTDGRGSLLLLLPCCRIWLSGPEFQDLDKRTLGLRISGFRTSIFGPQDLGFKTSTGARTHARNALRESRARARQKRDLRRVAALLDMSGIPFCRAGPGRASVTDPSSVTDGRTDRQGTLYIRLVIWVSG